MYKVLIVDDEWQTVRGLSTQTDWEAYNMEVYATVTSGQDVLNILPDHPIDLLITDVSMPKMDGLTLISLAKQIRPSLRCMIISAYSEFDYAKKALQLGVENYLLKPINENELRESILKTLQNLDRDRASASSSLPDVLAFRTNILDRWVNGTIQDFELFERAELLRIDLSAPEYRVCLLEIYEPGEAMNQVVSSSSLLDICRSGLLYRFQGECFLDASFRVVMILQGRDLASAEELLEADLRQVIREAANLGVRAFASLGPPVSSSSLVYNSHTAARLHLHYRFLDPSSPLIICEGPSNGKQSSLQIDGIPVGRQHMDKSLREGNAQLAQSIVNSVLKELSGQPPAIVKARSLSYILQLIQTMIDSGRITSCLPEAMLLRLSKYVTLTSREELSGWWSATILEAIRVIHERKGSFHLLVRHCLDHVHHSYHMELSLKTLAAGFNVSPAYLGRLFKDETGKYFNDFLTEIRLEASKALLSETHLKISEIVQQIGIPNQSYFNRLFKKMYALSPMEFRRQTAKRQP